MSFQYPKTSAEKRMAFCRELMRHLSVDFRRSPKRYEFLRNGPRVPEFERPKVCQESERIRGRQDTVETFSGRGSRALPKEAWSSLLSLLPELTPRADVT
jgi:hypothetical protein